MQLISCRITCRKNTDAAKHLCRPSYDFLPMRSFMLIHSRCIDDYGVAIINDIKTTNFRYPLVKEPQGRQEGKPCYRPPVSGFGLPGTAPPLSERTGKGTDPCENVNLSKHGV